MPFRRYSGCGRVQTACRKKVLHGVLALAFLLSASAISARVVTDQTGRRVNLPDHPRRLVSIAPSITETLYALGLGDRLVGDTDYCDYPPQARALPHVGALLNPNLEKSWRSSPTWSWVPMRPTGARPLTNLIVSASRFME